MGLLAVLQTKMGKPLTIHDIFIWLALQNSSIDALNLHTPHLGLCKSKVQPKERYYIKTVFLILGKSCREILSALCYKNLASWYW